MSMVWTMVLIVLCGCQSSQQTQPPNVHQVRSRLRAVIADDTCYSALNARGHISIIPDSLRWALFRPRYAREKLIAEGRAIVGPLLEIVSDPAEDKEVLEKAWDVLFQFDDLRISAALLEYEKAKRFSPFDFFILVTNDIGIPDVVMKNAGVNQQTAAEWLEGLVASGDYSSVLKLLDAAMQDILGFGVLFGADHLIRWLNRCGDLDIDELLAKEAPSALAWRNEQLAKGYDPLVAFRFSGEFAENQLAHALARVYADKRDRELSQAMFVAVYSRMQQPPKGWEDNLRTWYWAHRDRFVYDFQRHRFIAAD